MVTGGMVPPMLDLEVDKATRTEALKKWEEYRSTNNIGQEQLSASNVIAFGSVLIA